MEGFIFGCFRASAVWTGLVAAGSVPATRAGALGSPAPFSRRFRRGAPRGQRRGFERGKKRARARAARRSFFAGAF